MKLGNHLDVATPLVWITTDEPRRVIHEVIDNAKRPVFRLDVLDGLLQWFAREQRWKKVLVEIEPDNFQQTHDLQISILHVIAERGVMICENAHLYADKIISFLQHSSVRYTDMLYVDDADAVPATFVMLSCKEEVPPEVVRDVTRVQYALPTADEIVTMTKHLLARSGTRVSDNEMTAIVRAGQGMAEREFLHAAAESLAQHKQIDAQFVNKVKMDNLKIGGILEMRIPKINMEDIGGLDLAKELFRRTAWTWAHAAEAAEFGIEPLRRVLLIGVQGAGKSAICEAAASALGLDLAKFGASQAMSKWVGESEHNMRRAFKQVAAMEPLALWIDEFGRDMSGGQSSSETDGGTTDRVHGEFLQGIQELPNGVFLVCAANRIDALPPEMTRADRFDKIMFVGFPTEDERVEIFRIHLGQQYERYDLAALAQATDYFTGAEIKQLIKEVRFRVVGDHHRAPDTGDIVKFAPRLKGRIWTNHRNQIVSMYERARSEWDWASSGQESEALNVLKSARQNRAGSASAAKLEESVGKTFKDSLTG